MKETTHIRVGVDTLERLKKVSGEADKSIAEYVHDLAFNSSVPPNIQDSLEALRQSILKQLEDIKQDIAGLDNSWFRSFLKHEKDVLLMTNVQALMLKIMDKVNPGSWDYVIKEAERITKDDWAAHLKKNGISEGEDEA